MSSYWSDATFLDSSGLAPVQLHLAAAQAGRGPVSCATRGGRSVVGDARLRRVGRAQRAEARTRRPARPRCGCRARSVGVVERRVGAPAPAARGRGSCRRRSYRRGMRLLHTSDWHLGRTLHGVDLLDHQAAYLDHLVDVARTEPVDAVVVAGDVYDRAIPPVEAVELLSATLARLAEHDDRRR